MQSNDEPIFDVATTDLEGQQRTLYSSDRGHPRWR